MPQSIGQRCAIGTSWYIVDHYALYIIELYLYLFVGESLFRRCGQAEILPEHHGLDTICCWLDTWLFHE